MDNRVNDLDQCVGEVKDNSDNLLQKDNQSEDRLVSVYANDQQSKPDVSQDNDNCQDEQDKNEPIIGSIDQPVDIKMTQDNNVHQSNRIQDESTTIDDKQQNKLDVFHQLDNNSLIKEEDIDFLQQHSEDFKDRFSKKSIFRSKFEMESGVLNEDVHPTPDSKYWQAIGEQSVHLNELISLSYTSRKLQYDVDLTRAKMEELEYQLDHADFENEFNRRQTEAKLNKKKVELEEKLFGLVQQQKTAKERMREVKNWEDIIEKLIPQLKYGKDDWELHHPERYFKRYEKRVERLPILENEEKEHVLTHFLSFSKNDKNKELTQSFLKKHANDGIGQVVAKNANIPIKDSSKMLNNEQRQTQNNTTEEDSEISKYRIGSERNYESKDEMMDKDEITRKFFSRKTRKVLIGVPHRAKEDKSVTNFKNLQMPAAMDVMLESPYGLSVPDARNYLVEKAVKEGYQYLFFVDDDVLIPKDALVKLIHHNADVVGGFYYRKYMPLESCSMIEDGEGFPSIVKNFEIGDIYHNTLVLSSGCTLFKVDVFKKLDPPWYQTANVNDRVAVTEDTYICQKFRDMEVDIILDTSIQCLHVNIDKQLIYGHEEIVNSPSNKINERFKDYYAI